MLTRLTSVSKPQTELTRRIDRFRIVLIKPSKYDDDGYLIRFWKGVLPSNTLNVLHGLTEDVKERRVFGELPIEVTTFDETAEKVPISRIIRWGHEPRHEAFGVFSRSADQSVSSRSRHSKALSR